MYNRQDRARSSLMGPVVVYGGCQCCQEVGRRWTPDLVADLCTSSKLQVRCQLGGWFSRVVWLRATYWSVKTSHWTALQLQYYVMARKCSKLVPQKLLRMALL